MPATPACVVRRLAGFSVGSGVETAIPWDGEFFDPLGFHAAGSSQLVFPAGTLAADIYQVRAHVHWTNNGTGWRRIRVYKVGQFPETPEVLRSVVSANADEVIELSALWTNCSSGDTVEAKVTHTAGASLAVKGTLLTYLEIIKLGSTA